MRQQISPVAAAIAIIAVLAIAVFGWTRGTGVARKDGPPPTMPPDVSRKWSEMTGGAPKGTNVPGGGQPGRPSGPPPGMAGTGPGMAGAAPGGIPTGPPGGMPMGPGSSMPIGPPGMAR